ncbi:MULTISPECIES: diacylglycerol/lipid kinase family protein [Micromonospora]|uniref:Diacylglycerol kinase (ATP) n=1 Tax=Micromonospora yangpuensis TaxID=683228 RepID=A0A1C6UK97_9ACTN|nr:diacylglycerol kinase family protein [Micromonospora yangpuensis]GGM16928.1 diacylglycerol kinase [Micromonospora yangpuensis]SCL54477.1 diacylglycerol kinase (ATP) [Micromonospora yangpuensis]
MSLETIRGLPGLVIANPTAGTMRADLVTELTALATRFLPDVQVHWTTGRGDAETVARTAATRTTGRPGLIMAVGGDGTVREVVAGLAAAAGEADRAAEGGPALLVVPAGTGNSNHLAQWGDLPWTEAVPAALTPGGDVALRMFDLARLVETDELVLLGACSGLIAEALTYARDVPTTGRARYQVALARAARDHHPYPGRVEVDGVRVHEGPTVLANVGGGRHRGGQYQVLPHSVLDDGLLDVCVIGAETAPPDVPELTRRAAHLDQPGVVYARGRRITVSRLDGEPLWFEHDGELLPRSRSTVTLQVLPRVLPVLCRASRRAG